MTTESKTSKAEQPWPGRRVTHADFAERLFARRAELGQVDMPRNSGKRRTVSKRALLEAIAATGAKW